MNGVRNSARRVTGIKMVVVLHTAIMVSVIILEIVTGTLNTARMVSVILVELHTTITIRVVTQYCKVSLSNPVETICYSVISEE